MTRIARLRLLSLSITVALLSVLEIYAPAQQASSGDLLPRLFHRNEARHRGSRRNLEAILRDQPHFWHALQRMAARLETDPAWLLNVMACESLFNPDARNLLPGQTASGLLQIVESTARRLGTTTHAIRQMTPVQQLGLIERYLEPFKGRLKTLPDVYMAVLRGSIVAGGDAVVVIDAVTEPRIYGLNRSLDIDGDRRITKGELGLVALSIGRFLPARWSRQTEKGVASGKTAFVRGKGSESQAHGGKSRSPLPAQVESKAQPLSPTRTIYVRKR